MLYQLFPNQFSHVRSTSARQYVRIDGPFDTYGYIIKKQDSGTFLIRGTGKTKPV
jgi:hypothetical protein